MHVTLMSVLCTLETQELDFVCEITLQILNIFFLLSICLYF